MSTPVRRPMSLGATLMLRMAGAGGLVAITLLGFYAVRYSFDTRFLSETALRYQAQSVAEALWNNQDPRQLAPFRRHPRNYAFRIFNRRLLADQKVLSAANVGLLPIRKRPPSTDPQQLDPGLSEAFIALPRTGPSAPHPWLLTTRVVRGRRKLWVQVLMRGDPALLGLGVIGDEIIDHVTLPLGLLIPTLTLAMYLAIRSTVLQLRRAADTALAIGEAAASGARIERLDVPARPREMADLAIAMNTMLGAIERSMATLEAFSADVAHELRTPLAVLRLEADTLPRGTRRAQIAAEVDRLASLISELLRFAQSQATGARGPVDLAAIARRVCEDSAPEAVRRHQTIGLEIGKAGSPVEGNPALVEIAVRNIVGNALRHTGEGTHVEVRVEEGRRVIVEDDGDGPGGEPEGLFERFRRGAGSQGAGIGLALVRRVADLHAGSVRLLPRPDGGTICHFELAASAPL